MICHQAKEPYSFSTAMDRTDLLLVDLFAGCGGMGLGFHQAGYSTFLANELHPDPAQTYTENLLKNQKERMMVGSISEELSETKLSELILPKNGIACVSGGPPCQGFSNAGPGIANDPRNKLYMEFLRVVEFFMPHTVVFENVPGFVNRYGLGLKAHLEKKLTDLGYSTVSGVVKASDYGVPQLRKRFICLGIKKEILGGRKFSMPRPTWTTKMRQRNLRTNQIIDDLDVYEHRGGYGSGEEFGPEQYLRPAKSNFQKEMRRKTGLTTKGKTWNTKIPRHTGKVIQRMSEYQKGKTRNQLIDTELATKKHSQRALNSKLVPQITIVSLPDDFIHYNTTLPRTLSVRECARFQTFPDDFIFHGKRTTGGLRRRIDVPQYTQVGNAVPPRLAKAIADHLKSYLLNSD